MSAFSSALFPSFISPTNTISDAVLSSDEERDVAGPITRMHRPSKPAEPDRTRARTSFDSVSSVWGTTPLTNVPEHPLEVSDSSQYCSGLAAISFHPPQFAVAASRKNARSQSYSVGQQYLRPSSLKASLSRFPESLLPANLCDDGPSLHPHTRFSDDHNRFGLHLSSGGFCLDGLGASSLETPPTTTASYVPTSGTQDTSTSSPWARKVAARPLQDQDGAASVLTPNDPLWIESQKLSRSLSTCRSPSDSNSVLSSVGHSPTEQSRQSPWPCASDLQLHDRSALTSQPFFDPERFNSGPGTFLVQSRRHSVALPTRFETSTWGHNVPSHNRPSVPNIYSFQPQQSSGAAPMMKLSFPSTVSTTTSDSQGPNVIPTAPSVPMALDQTEPSPATVASKPNRILYAVSFKCDRVDIYYVPASSPLRPSPGHMVIVEGDRGFDLGMVTHADITVQQADVLKEQGIQASVRCLLGYSRQFCSPGENTGPSRTSSTSGPAKNSGAIDQMVRSIMAKRAAILKFKNHSSSPSANHREPRYKALRRLASPSEIAGLQVMRELEAKAIRICQNQADAMGKPMEILATEFQADYHKLTFYYYSNEYVDFNSLVKCLFRSFKTRLWMSAINPDSFAIMAEQKEEARMEREREKEREKMERSGSSRCAHKWNSAPHPTQDVVGLGAASSEFQRCSFASGTLARRGSFVASGPSAAESPFQSPSSGPSMSEPGSGHDGFHTDSLPQTLHYPRPSVEGLSSQMGQLSVNTQGTENHFSQNGFFSQRTAAQMTPWSANSSHFPIARHSPFSPPHTTSAYSAFSYDSGELQSPYSAGPMCSPPELDSSHHHFYPNVGSDFQLSGRAYSGLPAVGATTMTGDYHSSSPGQRLQAASWV